MKIAYELRDGLVHRSTAEDAPIRVYSAPSREEREELRATLGLDDYDLDAALDAEEIPRLEFGQHGAANHGCALQYLHGGELTRHGLHGLVELLDACHRVDLRDLRGHLRVVQRVHRILVVQLGDEQLQEAGLHGARVGR